MRKNPMKPIQYLGLLLVLQTAMSAETLILPVQFGKDTVMVPQQFNLTITEDQKEALDRLRKVARDNTPSSNKNLPLRKGATVFFVPKHSLQGEDDKGIVAPITVENVGYFMRKIVTADECRAMIGLVNSYTTMAGFVLSAEVLEKIIAAIDKEAGDLPLNVLVRQVDKESLAIGCYERDGTWYWHLLLLEGTFVWEYKYVVDKDNHIGVFKRVLIEGPKDPIPFDGPDRPSPNHAKIRRCADFLWQIIRPKENPPKSIVK